MVYRLRERHTGKFPVAFVLASGLALSGCQTTTGEKEGIGTVIGGVVGGLVGSQIGEGRGRLIATGLGVAAGAFIGQAVGRHLDEVDRQNLARATEVALASGQAQTWTNPDTGVSGQAEVSREERHPGTVPVRVQKDRVDQIPPLDLIGETYIATSDVNVRSGPGTEYRRVGSVTNGEAVPIVGKVQGQGWYLVSRDGAAGGFVAARYLRPAPAHERTLTAAAPPSPSAGTDTTLVSATQTCRTITQTVTFADGRQEQGEVRACQGPNGWEIQAV